MKALLLYLYGLLLLSEGLFAQAQEHRRQATYVYPMNQTPQVYSCDSLLAVLQREQLSTENIFVVKGSYLRELLGRLGSLDKLYIFNEVGCFVEIAPENSCFSPLLLLANSNLNTFPVNKRLTIDTFLNYSMPCSSTRLMDSVPTMMIFWNLTDGMSEEDNPFLWERAIRERWGDAVNIIKINTDVNNDWSPENQKKYLKFYQGYLNAIRAKSEG